MNSTPPQPRDPMPPAARVVAILFGVAAVLAIVAIPISWSLLGADSGAGEISPGDESRGRIIYLVLGCALAAIYGGAAWTIWTGKNWAVAMLLSVCAIFGFPVGSAISIASIVVLSLRSVRTKFHS